MPESETGAPKIAERGAPGRFHLAALRIDGPALRAPLDLPSPALTLRQRRGPLSHATHVLAQASLCQATLSRDTLCPKRTPALICETCGPPISCFPRLPAFIARSRACISIPSGPWPRALVTHGHADHARAGHGAVLATAETLGIMAVRYGENFAETTPSGRAWTAHRHRRRHRDVPSGRPRARLRPDRVRGRGLRIVVSGDYKRADDPTCAAFRGGALRRVHHRGHLRPAGVPPPGAARRGGQAARLRAPVSRARASCRSLCARQGAAHDAAHPRCRP